jgi:hypothetical protein
VGRVIGVYILLATLALAMVTAILAALFGRRR